MPIKAINPDGTVTIVRQDGSDPKTVKPEELAQYNPTLVGNYNEYVKAQSELEGDPQPTEAQKTKQAGAETELDMLETLAKEIIKSTETGENVSGRFTGGAKEKEADIRELLPNILGLKDTEAYQKRGDRIKNIDTLRSQASMLAAQVAFGEAGKAFTETERALLAGQIPNLDREKPTNTNFLFKMLGKDVGTKGVEGAVLDTEEELNNKMQNLLWAIDQKRQGKEITGFPKSGAFTIEEVE